MASESSRATVTVAAHALWRIRLKRELSRHLLQALAVAGLLASARMAIAPPTPPIARSPTAIVAPPDPAGEGFASLFARRYLSWDSRDPEARRIALAPFVGASMEADAGLQPPTNGTQQVQWTQVVQARELTPAGHVYTIAVQTDPAGLLYLTVSVEREPNGELALAGYPAFVGAPFSTTAKFPTGLREVEDPTLSVVVGRALRNYLARDESELAADLSAEAHVSLPGLTLALQSVQRLDWSTRGRAVLAVVQAEDERGTQYTLAYELTVVSDAGRWEISAIQTNPDSQLAAL
jgi:hypothetical protein